MPTIQVLHTQLQLSTFRGLELFGRGPIIEVTASRVPLRGTLNLTGKIPDRARGLLLRSYDPNVALSTPQPNKGVVSLSGKSVVRLDTTPQPTLIPTFRRPTVLEGWNAAVGVGQEADPSSLYLRGVIPLSYTESPTFVPSAYNLTLTGYATITSRLSSPDNGSLALSAKLPVRSVSVNSLPQTLVGTLSLAGQAPVVSGPAINKTPAAGGLVLSAQLAYYGGSLRPARFRAVLRPKLPVVIEKFSYTITPTEAALALAEQTPVAFSGPRIIVAEATLTLAGQAGSISVPTDVYKYPARLSVALAGQTPLNLVTTKVYPGEATLTVSTYGPGLQQTQTLYDSADTRIISVTTRRSVVLLYD